MAKKPNLNLNFNINFSDIKNKIQAKLQGGRSREIPLEINLVPDIKNEMIKTLKLRNFIFFLCIVIGSASLGTVAVFASIAGGQQAIVDAKKSTITNLSTKLGSYSDLGDFLTIKDQLGNISSISDRKKLLSRIFSTLSALLPTSGDSITISELSVNLATDSPTLSFDAQANANNPPYIDYNVLDSFKKSMQYMRYDYGNYVDREGAEIPAYCMIENGNDGATLSDPEKGIYAYWLITGDGCNPSYDGDDPSRQTSGYTTEEYNGQTVVKIWRTPQFTEWYKDDPKPNEPTLTIDGTIENVAHFESTCLSYAGSIDDNTKVVTWTSNNECMLVPDGVDGIVISDSSNGRGSNEELVLRFSSVITLNSEVFNFSNKHMLAIGPTGRHNVTDSYVQIQNMFGERASDCPEGDTACYNNSNTGGN
ncbi:hypothetical protein IJ118_01345 [Candidatus Saccharibacteria bacterium]|nr:hypothetical protein [Candidatus Saccharibacteria bacterium]